MDEAIKRNGISEKTFMKHIEYSTIYLRNIYTTICPREFTQVSVNGN